MTAGDFSARSADEAVRLLAAIVESANDAIVTKTLDGTIRTWNPAAERMLGYTAEEIVGQPITRLIPPDRLAEEADIIARITRGERVNHLETVRRTKDGRLLDVSLTVSPVCNDSGAIFGASKIMRDIGERKSAEHLRQANAAMQQRAAVLEEVNAELESFSYSVSHDLHAPVRAIVGYTRAIQDTYGAVLDPEVCRWLAIAHDEAVRMSVMIDDLLAFSRLAVQPMQSVPVDMLALVLEVVTELAGLAAVSSATIDVGALPGAYGDRALLRHVWFNLISNAIKFSSVRERPEIAITGEVVDGRATYRVRDNGAGFDMRYAGKLFGVFARLHGEAEFPGTGVGLAIVRRIVARHGGSVDARGARDGGATFAFELPVAGDV
jgi:PAS domain S-box-containing protein